MGLLVGLVQGRAVPWLLPVVGALQAVWGSLGSPPSLTSPLQAWGGGHCKQVRLRPCRVGIPCPSTGLGAQAPLNIPRGAWEQ